MGLTVEQGVTIGAGITMGPVPVPSRFAHTITTIPNAQVSTAQVKFGTGSYTSNSTNGGLLVTPYSDFAFGTYNFTIEFWYYPTTLAADQVMVDMRPKGLTGAYTTIWLPAASGVIAYYTVGANRIVAPAGSTPVNQWSAVAIVRYNSVTKMYINGTQVGVSYADSNNYLAGGCTINCNGYTQNGGTPIRGNMDELRISSIARYTGNYTPATEPFVNDQYTLLLTHFDGTNGSTVFTDSTST